MKSSSINIKDLKIKIDFLDVVNNFLVIYGSLSKKLPIDCFYFVDDCDNKYEVEVLDTVSSQNNSFFINIDMHNIEYLIPKFIVDDVVSSIKIEFGKYSKLNNIFASLYLRGDKNIIKYNKSCERFDIYKNNFINTLICELKCTYFLIKKCKFKNLLFRAVTNVFNFFKSREIWLISDSYNLANDNGEHFFKYVINEKLNPDTKYFFAINKNSRDRKRLYYNYSNVININSLKYKFLYLISSKVISSYMEDASVDPFGNDKIYLSDLCRFKIIYLQHQNESWEFGDKNFCIDMIVTNNCDDMERLGKSFVRRDIVKLTGFARNDFEDEKVMRQVLILFKLDSKESSDFCNKLINDRKVLNALEKYNYKLRVISNEFDTSFNNDIFSVANKDVIYNEEMGKSMILATDNISLANDFSYLKRLSICKSSNREEVLGNSCEKYELFVKELVNAMKNDGCLDKSLLKKIDNYFKFNDNSNCERIYEEICNLN